MKRRNFLLSGSASLATAGLTACGGGGGADGQSGAALPETGALRSTGPVATDPAAGGAVTAAATGDTAGGAPSRAAKQTGTATPTASVRYPFGARLTPYSAGILPSQSVWTMDDLLRRQYDAWKAARVVPVGWIAPGGYAVQSSQWNTLTVSEAMGYGMLLTVLFAGHDPNARSIFDGLLAVVRARPAWAVTPHDPGGKYLMDWKLASNGSSMGDGWNALDGDLDIALALLMADKQWGSSGGWNYLQEGKNTIEAIKSWNVKADGTMEGLSNRSHNRTS
ncbi:MAG TPA: glycosyl hydrolase family 8, partial [Ramlibacter sp.]